ncbi:MAG: RNA polymerase subunit sigma-70 [Bryobacteraceae bacterium]|nr:RNA polymerase subunit sigma-70 [Bryobacteraceae bacterium]
MQASDVTLLLQRWRGGDRDAEGRLFELILPELRRLARRQLQRERRDHTLEPTELVDQMYLRLAASAGAREIEYRNRAHFFAIAARVMRRILIDYARGRSPAVFLDADALAGWGVARDAGLEQAAQLDLLLDELEKQDPAGCSVVELKFFLGLTDEETSEALGQPVRTIQRQWHDARRWLFERLSGGARPS